MSLRKIHTHLVNTGWIRIAGTLQGPRYQHKAEKHITLGIRERHAVGVAGFYATVSLRGVDLRTYADREYRVVLDLVDTAIEVLSEGLKAMGQE